MNDRWFHSVISDKLEHWFYYEFIRVSATEKSVIFSLMRFLHAEINLFESFLSNKKLEENNDSVESY